MNIIFYCITSEQSFLCNLSAQPRSLADVSYMFLNKLNIVC